MATSDRDWDALWAVQDKAKQHFVAKFGERFRTKGHARMFSNVGKGYWVLLHRSTIEGCGLQLTKFDDKNKPWGHNCFETPEEAADFIWQWDLPVRFKERLYRYLGWDGRDEEALMLDSD